MVREEADQRHGRNCSGRKGAADKSSTRAGNVRDCPSPPSPRIAWKKLAMLAQLRRPCTAQESLRGAGAWRHCGGYLRRTRHCTCRPRTRSGRRARQAEPFGDKGGRLAQGTGRQPHCGRERTPQGTGAGEVICTGIRTQKRTSHAAMPLGGIGVAECFSSHDFFHTPRYLKRLLLFRPSDMRQPLPRKPLTSVLFCLQTNLKLNHQRKQIVIKLI